MFRRSPLALALLAAITLPVAGWAADSAMSDADYTARMHQEHAHDTTAPSPAATLEPRQPVEEVPVTYGLLGGKAVNGYFARPTGAKGSLPALIVIQEWWGLNDNIRAMARRWAGEGYETLAVDLYEGKVATTPDEAMALVKHALADPDRLTDNLNQAHAWLRARPEVTKIGVIGWCFGGGWSLQTALAQGSGISAAVVYYGRPVESPAELAKLQAPLLAFYGGLDKSIPQESVRAMQHELEKLHREVTVVVYPDANHAFANPTGERYNAKAAHDAWTRATAFFARYLQTKN